MENIDHADRFGQRGWEKYASLTEVDKEKRPAYASEYYRCKNAASKGLNTSQNVSCTVLYCFLFFYFFSLHNYIETEI
jgi:hypothetical protein